LCKPPPDFIVISASVRVEPTRPFSACTSFMSQNGSRVEQTKKLFRGIRPAVLPSLLLCDFANLQREVERLEEAGVEALHLDVMDGQFVPNLTYGMPIVESLRKITSLKIDVHLMIAKPESYAKAFVDAGADLITFHIEAHRQPVQLLDEIRSLGVAAGLAINPSTPMDWLIPFVPNCDLVLIMSVQAGFGGQAFNPIALQRLKMLREAYGPELLLEVDGGINCQTTPDVTFHGADLLVVGSAIFREADYCQAMTRLRCNFKPFGAQNDA